MRNLILSIAIFISSFNLFGQGSKVESDLRKLEQAERIAMLHRDTTTLLRLWAPDFIANTPANRITKSRKELFDLMKMGIFNFSSFEREIENIFIKGNVAVIMGNETVVPVSNNPKQGHTIRRRYTNIWIKE